ncbi:MAG: TlpA family protein disulfide reductase [Actinobacteria bacterium]|jgi:thiol-disulfide isomerase/thioredoxin|nr:TlpA family protein disulfide reductase [Actinomycetota bacterium]NBR67820.1 TlpA family protein disulfide reductase [Actinomycetota bacterium]
MDGIRARRAAVAILIALIVGVVGGWAMSRSSDDVDANLTDPGLVPGPGIGTNVDSTGRQFTFVGMIPVGSRDTVTPSTGGLPAVVNFWYSTCQPCRREMPVLAAAANRYAGRVAFIGVNPNDTPESATTFLDTYGATFPNYLDRAGEQLAESQVGTMPTTFFLDARGEIVTMHAGELTEEDLTGYLVRAGVSP